MRTRRTSKFFIENERWPIVAGIRAGICFVDLLSLNGRAGVDVLASTGPDKEDALTA